MFDLKEARPEDFVAIEGKQSNIDPQRKTRVIFYRVKKGCLKPEAPELTYCKLSDVL